MTRKEVAVAAAFYTVLTIVLTYPLSLTPGRATLSGEVDVQLYAWTLAWDAHAFATKPWAIFDANIFFPYDNTLAYSENLIGSAFVAAPFFWSTGNAVLAMNLVAMSSVVLSGLGTYVLARGIGMGPAAALAGGIIFAFSPARFFRFAQLHLTALQWMPFTLAALHGYFESGKRWQLRLAIALFTLQALTSLHGAVFLSIAVAVFLVHRAALGAPIGSWQRLRDAGVTGIALLAPILWLIPPYLRAQREMGLVRTLENWVATPESFLASPTHAHTWLMSHLTDAPINERASALLFPGYVPLMLAAVALLTARHSPHRPHIILYGTIAAIGLVLCAPPPLSLWPHVYSWPVFNFIRVPSRFFLLAMVGVAVLAAIGFDRLVAALAPRRRVVASALLCVLLLGEFAAAPLPVVPYDIAAAPADRWLASQNGSFAIAEVPADTPERYQTIYMLHAMSHWQKTVHGYSGLRPALHERLYRELRHFPDDISLASLRGLGVKYVVVHVDMYRPGEWSAVERRLEQYAGRIALEYGDATGRVYRLE
jgi:hypothetical protein